MRKSSDIIEDFIASLETLVDSLDDEWYANKEGRWRQADEIRKIILPANKEKFKLHLDEYIDRRIQTYCDKYNVQRTTFTDEE